MNPPNTNPFMLALDSPSWGQAQEWLEVWKPFVGALKLGPRLILGTPLEKLSQWCRQFPCFWDFKFYDIESTLVANVQKAWVCGAYWVSISGWAYTPSVWKRLFDVYQQFQVGEPVLVAGLTSHGPDWWERLGLDPVQWRLAQWEAWFQTGFRWVVVAGQDLPELKSRFPHSRTIVPGIRWNSSFNGDEQVRTMDPVQALESGADYIVLGRAFLDLDPNTDERWLHLWQKVQGG